MNENTNEENDNEVGKKDKRSEKKECLKENQEF